MSFSTLTGYGRSVALAAALAAYPVLALSQDQPSDTDQYSQQSSQYNQGTETTLEGTVVSVNPSTTTGQHVILDTDHGRYDVQLAPQAYLQQQQISIQPGQRLQVTGSQTTMNGQQALIARQLKADGNTVTLRTSSGIPLWSASQQSQAAGAAQMGPYGQQQGQYSQGQQGQFGPCPTATSQQGQCGQYPQPAPQQTYMGQGQYGQVQPTQIGIANWQRGGIYNPFTETTLTGTVEQVRTCNCGPFSSTYATMNTNQGRITVQLAPSQYLSQNQLQLSRGQQIQVTGSRLDVNGNQVLLARVVSTPQRTVALRNAQGMPQWTQTGQAGFADGTPSTDNSADFDEF